MNFEYGQTLAITKEVKEGSQLPSYVKLVRCQTNVFIMPAELNSTQWIVAQSENKFGPFKRFGLKLYEKDLFYFYKYYPTEPEKEVNRLSMVIS